MNTKELIKLAYKADIEGDLELADFIDRELLAASNNKNIREAAGLSDSVSKMGRGVGNFFGNIGNFLGGYGGYNGPTNNPAARKLLQQVPQSTGLGKTFGAVTKEITHTPAQLTELANGLMLSMFNSRSKATPEVGAIMDDLINGVIDGKNITPTKLNLLRQHAIQNKIISPRSELNLDDFDNVIKGKPLAAGPRTVQRVNKNTKLLAGGAAAAAAAPGLYGAFGPQAPEATGSDIPNGPAMNGMPQLGPGMGGFGGGYNGPQAGSPQGNNYNPQNIGLGSVNSAFDPKSVQQSAGFAPETGYSGRSEREINPAARFRSYEGMTRGESAPAYNNQSYSQPAVAPIITPQVNVPPVAAPAVAPAALTSIPPVNTEAAPPPVDFADALRPATPADVARYEQPPTTPLTPEQIGAAMNPLATSGY
jgi:hypothetical protein